MFLQVTRRVGTEKEPKFATTGAFPSLHPVRLEGSAFLSFGFTATNA